MQEFIRSGDEHKHIAEVAILEKNADYSHSAHLHRLEEKRKAIEKTKGVISRKASENKSLENQLVDLQEALEQRQEIFIRTTSKATGKVASNTLKEIFTRRKLADLARSQAQDIAILREEVERLRLRTYPAFAS